VAENRRFRKITESDLETIMNWRMRPDITKYMYTDPKLTINDQKKWFSKISADKNSFYWIYEESGKAMGLVSLVDWDKGNSVIHSGGYIAEKEGRTLKNIVDVNMNMYDYVFNVLGVNKAAFEIMDHNVGQIQWMKRLGATQEGVLRQAIKKDKKFYDLYLFSFLREEWDGVLRKNRFNKFEIE